MENCRVIGLDLAKKVFQVHVLNESGKKELTRQLKREDLLAWFTQQPLSKVGMEACGGAHEWAREITKLGHEVKLMAPQHVKPYVQGNKTDARDAAGIAEAATREAVRGLAIQTRANQALQSLHRVRQRWMKDKVATINQLRGLLLEMGEVLPEKHKLCREAAYRWAEQEASTELNALSWVVKELLTQWETLEEQIKRVEQQLKHYLRRSVACQVIESIPGVGVLTATAVVASYGDCSQYPTPRQFSCALGLTPREHSSGGKQVLLGISKRGNGYIRQLLIHGARAVLAARLKRPAYEKDWVVQLALRRGINIAVVALAAKNARRICAMLKSGEWFRSDSPQAETA